MNQIDLDKGILERLMSNNNPAVPNTAATQASHITTKDTSSVQSKSKSKSKTELPDAATNLQTTSVFNQLTDTTMPIVQVINIQNIATSAFLLKYNKSQRVENSSVASVNKKSAGNNRKKKTSGSSSGSSSAERHENDADDEEMESGNDKQDSLVGKKSADRYLLILSDGEFYETRCLLLPNLNYLVSFWRFFRLVVIEYFYNLSSGSVWECKIVGFEIVPENLSWFCHKQIGHGIFMNK